MIAFSGPGRSMEDQEAVAGAVVNQGPQEATWVQEAKLLLRAPTPLPI